MTKSSSSANGEGFRELCKAHGLTVTEQRRCVYSALCGTTSHPTADQVYEMVRPVLPTISRTTVYRVLEALADSGLIQRVPHPWSAARFDGDAERHHHLVCRLCGRVFDLHDAKLSDLDVPRRRIHGFKIEDYSIVFSGTCTDCRHVN